MSEATKESFENNIHLRKKAYRKSSGVPKNVLLTPDATNPSELTHEFTGFIDSVRQLKEENEKLKEEKKSLISLCNEEIMNIKTTYGGEINALRKALEETTKEKCTTELNNDKLLEENDGLKRKIERKIETIDTLNKKYEETEAKFRKTHKVIEQYDIVCLEKEEIGRYNCSLNDQLKCEIIKRNDAERRILTLSDEVEFLKKISSSTSIFTRESSINSSTKTESCYKDQLEAGMKEMREELTKEFDQYLKQMESSFHRESNKLKETNLKLSEKVNKIHSEKKELQSMNEAMIRDIEVMDLKMAELNAKDTRNATMLAKITKEHHDFIKDMCDENTNLKHKLNQMSLEVSTLVSEKIANEKETHLFRSMLKGEKSRLNLSEDNSSKRRKVEDDNVSDEISAWSKGSVNISYISDYEGNYLQMMNHSSEEINLNEWKIEIETKHGSELVYTFAPRLLLGKTFLKVWSLGQDITEDDENLIMNVSLPSSEVMKCRLNNDMDEMEASFYLNRFTDKRKILKVRTKGTQHERYP